jgi:adenine-specific DNA-methyltransferase
MPGLTELEARRRAEQDRLDRLKGADERNKLGQFATPNRLAVAIASQMLRLRGDGSGSLRFLDPSVGSGSFYSALRQVSPPESIGQAAGIEIDPLFASVASDLWSPLGLQVTLGDLTRLDPPPIGRRATLILANPPYVRHHHLDLDEKRRLKHLVRQRLGVDVSGLAGLYVHFLLLCDAWLEEGGLAAWLIPSEFMDVNYGSVIKNYLADRVRLRQIHRFRPADAQFGDALVTSAVVIFEKARPVAEGTVLLSYGGSLEDPEIVDHISLEDLRAARKWTNFPRAKAPSREGDATTTTLGDLFTIRRGLVTGANDFFIMTREEALGRGVSERFLRPILPSPRYVKEPIIEADEQGDPTVDRPLVLLDCNLPEDEVRSDHPSLWAYFQEGVARGLNEGYLTSRRSPWYTQERRESSPFVCTYMGRHRGGRAPFRFLWNRSRAIAANVYLMLYPKATLFRVLKTRPALEQVVFGLLQEIRPDHFIEEGRVYGGGLHKMEPKELAALPADSILRAIGRPAPSQQATLAGF